MWLLGVALVLTVLRYLQLGPLAALSWWWIVAMYALVFLWFEVAEKWLGLKKRQARNDMEAMRRARIEHTLSPHTISRKRR
jgi:small Trp-rich protein